MWNSFKRASTSTAVIDDSHLRQAKNLVEMVRETMNNIERYLGDRETGSPLLSFAWQEVGGGWSTMPIFPPKVGCGRASGCPIVESATEFSDLCDKMSFYLEMGKKGNSSGMVHYAESGRRIFLLGGRVQVLGMKEELSEEKTFIYVPPNTSHSLLALEDSLLLSIFVPPVVKTH